MKISEEAKRHNQTQFRRLLKAFKKAANEIDDLSPVLKAFADRFLKSRRFIFDRNRVGTGQYDDLVPQYKDYKRRKYGRAYPILLATGKLKKSITTKGGDNITKIGRKNLILGTTVPYSRYLQEGTGKMPDRPFLFWGPEAPKFASDSLTKNLHKNMAIALLTHVERVMGKNLEASIKTARAKAEDLFR